MLHLVLGISVFDLLVSTTKLQLGANYTDLSTSQLTLIVFLVHVFAMKRTLMCT